MCLKIRSLLYLFFLCAVSTLSATERIISLAPDLTETLYALSLQDEIVAVSEFSNFPKEAQKKQTIGTFMAPSLEKILYFKPTVIIAKRHATPQHLLQKLRQSGIHLLEFKTQHEIDIFEMILQLGKKFGKEQKAKRLCTSLKEMLFTIQNRVRNLEKPRVLIQIELVPPMFVGKQTLLDRAIELAGGMNAIQHHKGYPKLQKEAALQLNPDIILIPLTKGDENKSQDIQSSWKSWVSVPAVRHHRIFTMDGDLTTRAGPRFGEGIAHMAHLLHPTSVKK
ncbi:MAG: ABC transporter substrate-binding protein [Deltaproteobacteria bacterium]|nr:ABC transporter substrate-binding protein [Deltaproteobacteria bacterium]